MTQECLFSVCGAMHSGSIFSLPPQRAGREREDQEG
jgi:hypothetical protein